MENSAISWTDHTFNPVMGCTKVSDGCKFCYAEELMDHRYGRVQWGPAGTRVRTGADKWKDPLRWNKDNWFECISCHWRGSVKKAEIASDGKFACPLCHSVDLSTTRQRVFCASLSDVFEDHPDWEEPRADLLRLISDTPNLDWMLLTKRPQNIMSLTEKAVEVLLRTARSKYAVQWGRWIQHGLPHAPANVWIGTSVENQAAADDRIPHLLNVPARVRFLSCEPLLGPVNIKIGTVPGGIRCIQCLDRGNYFINGYKYDCKQCNAGRVHWVICGGESGHKARPMNPQWVKWLRDDCLMAGIKFHFKQFGEFLPYGISTPLPDYVTDWAYLDDKCTIAAFPDGTTVKRVGKHKAGRVLDGRTWNEFPSTN